MPGEALREADFDVAPDWRSAVVSRAIPEPRGGQRRVLVGVDVGTGERRTLLDDPGFHFAGPAISPDGAVVAALRERRASPTAPPRVDLVTVPLAGGPVVELTGGGTAGRAPPGGCRTLAP